LGFRAGLAAICLGIVDAAHRFHVSSGHYLSVLADRLEDGHEPRRSGVMAGRQIVRLAL
jgi:hypothetical protein